MAIRLHRMGDDQIPQVFDLLQESISTRRTPETWAADHMTALLLGDSKAPTAAMPLARREIRISENKTLKVGWVSGNQFALKMGTRRLSRATVNQWPSLLPDLDALVVVQKDQHSTAAKWNQQVGFHQVLAVRCLYLEMEEAPQPPSGRYHTRIAENAQEWGEQMLAVYRDVFSHYGGMVPRDRADYWDQRLKFHYYRDHYQFQIVGLWNEADGSHPVLMGYAVVGWSGWHSKRPRMDILELATRQWDTQVAQELIQTTCQLAWSKQVREVRAVVSVHDPYRGYLTRTGFTDRWGYAMSVKWLHPQRYLDAMAAGWPEDTGVQINTPDQVSLTLQNPKVVPTRLIRLQAPPSSDAATITRLLLQRLDIPAAVHQGQLLILDGREGDMEKLALFLPWTPWVFHMVDYI